ncbi:hypothetical protein L6164_030705 [Bauhinia variegata]|uniref:Uncharacterized protein n=1 Tax=Bauhinia variegata TaxID=167791 RepID=A0ACB9LEI4_BAUVA|nr:hypothetical protein L6164_030705 [Bauhinia variegata]
MTGGEYSSDQKRLLGSQFNYHEDSQDANEDVEAQDVERTEPASGSNSSGKGGAFTDFLKHLDRGLSGRRHSFKHLEKDNTETTDKRENGDIRDHSHSHHLDLHVDSNDVLGDSAPPEWALLLIGCLLGLATGLCVAAFNKGVRR